MLITLPTMSQATTATPQNITTRNADSEADTAPSHMISNIENRGESQNRTIKATRYVFDIAYQDKVKLLNVLDEESNANRGLWRDLAKTMKINAEQIEVSP